MPFYSLFRPLNIAFLMTSLFMMSAEALSLSWAPEQGASEWIQIQGRSVQVTNVTRRPTDSGQKVIHSAILREPEDFSFFNQIIRVEGQVLLHDNGNLWVIEGLKSKKPLSLITPLLQLNLNCSQRPEVNNVILPKRMVEFHSNGQYFRGCQSLSASSLSLPDGTEIVISATAQIDLSEQGNLTYASSINQWQLILNTKNNQKTILPLMKGTEISFHENQTPHFFTPQSHLRFQVSISESENLWIQSGEHPVSVQQNEKGHLERGILGQDLIVGPQQIKLPQGSAVIYENSILQFAKFPQPMKMTLDSYALLISQIQFDESGAGQTFEVSEPFVFYPPEDPTRPLSIPAHAKITLASNGKIAHIETVGFSRETQ